jgi:2-dehydropantoate 2-reductase
VKVAIVGAGAIGGLTGAWMSKAGEDVTFVDVNREHVEAIRTRGLYIDGARDEHRLPPQKAFTPAELTEPLECVFLAVKSQHTREATEGIKHLLGPDSFVVSLQNGLVNEEVIASVIGAERTIGALPDYGGAYVDPGHLEFVIEGPVYVGELNGRITPRIQEVYRLLSHVAECHLLTDIKARVWAKRCFGGQTVASALVDAPYHVVLSDERALRVTGPLVREALEVAYAYGVNVPSGPFFEPGLYFPQTAAETERLFAFVRATVARQARHVLEHEKAGKHRYVKQGSGIHWDIVYRKRKSEVRWNHGPLEEKAAVVGVPLPLNTRLHRMIYELEDREREFGWHNFAELYDVVCALGKQLPGA